MLVGALIAATSPVEACIPMGTAHEFQAVEGVKRQTSAFHPVQTNEH